MVDRLISYVLYRMTPLQAVAHLTTYTALIWGARRLTHRGTP